VKLQKKPKDGCLYNSSNLVHISSFEQPIPETRRTVLRNIVSHIGANSITKAQDNQNRSKHVGFYPEVGPFIFGVGSEKIFLKNFLFCFTQLKWTPNNQQLSIECIESCFRRGLFRSIQERQSVKVIKIANGIVICTPRAWHCTLVVQHLAVIPGDSDLEMRNHFSKLLKEFGRCVQLHQVQYPTAPSLCRCMLAGWECTCGQYTKSTTWVPNIILSLHVTEYEIDWRDDVFRGLLLVRANRATINKDQDGILAMLVKCASDVVCLVLAFRFNVTIEDMVLFWNSFGSVLQKSQIQK